MFESIQENQKVLINETDVQRPNPRSGLNFDFNVPEQTTRDHAVSTQTEGRENFKRRVKWKWELCNEESRLRCCNIRDCT